MHPLYVAAALLPAVSRARLGDRGSRARTLERRQHSRLVRNVTPDALLYSAVCAVVAAPLAGVAVRALAAPRPRHGAHVRGVGGADASRALGVSAESLQFIATSHAVLACATLALAALGALLGTVSSATRSTRRRWRSAWPLTAAYGVLVAGAPVAELSTGLLKAALLASPVMTVATAAHVDLVRTDIWYQVSPLAHVRLEYPAWGTVCAWYLVAGCAGFVATAIATPKAGQGEGRQ